MKVLIVENESFASDNLIHELGMLRPAYSIAAVCRSFDEAIKAIPSVNPALVFLDVHLDGEKTGIDLMKELRKPAFKVIFTTAYDEFALAAFRFNAVDYLLKPYTRDELLNALLKVESSGLRAQQNSIRDLQINLPDRIKETRRMSLKNCKGEYLIRKTDEILFLEADGSYVNVYLTDNTSICTAKANLTDFELLLKASDFVRIHQKYLVNLHYINKYSRQKPKSLSADTGSGGYIELKTGITLPVSRGNLSQVKNVFGI